MASRKGEFFFNDKATLEMEQPMLQGGSEQQLAGWLQVQGLEPKASAQDRLCFLWQALQQRERRLVVVTTELDSLRSLHAEEMADVHKSLARIRGHTEQKRHLTEETQAENNQLRQHLQKLVSVQDAHTSETAGPLCQRGPAGRIPRGPGQRLTYRLAERDSSLEEREGSDGPPATPLMPHAQSLKEVSDQVEASLRSAQQLSVEDQCALLKRDLEEGSRRLAAAHAEIRWLVDELESARLTLCAYEMVELREAKEQNDDPEQEARDNNKSTFRGRGVLDEQEVAQQLLGSENEICDLLRSLDRERSKCHKLQLKHEARLHRAGRKLGAETKWRNERIDSLERGLSLSNYSLLKNKEFIVTITAANEKLMFEKRQLMEQLTVEELKNASMVTSSVADRRVNFLERESLKLDHITLQMCHTVAALEHTLRNMEHLNLSEKMCQRQNGYECTSMALDTRGVTRENIQRSDEQQTEVTSYPDSPLGGAQTRPSEMGYMNLTAGGSSSKHPGTSLSLCSSARLHMV